MFSFSILFLCCVVFPYWIVVSFFNNIFISSLKRHNIFWPSLSLTLLSPNSSCCSSSISLPALCPLCSVINELSVGLVICVTMHLCVWLSTCVCETLLMCVELCPCVCVWLCPGVCNYALVCVTLHCVCVYAPVCVAMHLCA